jgi:hypothetical protein
LPTTNVNLPIEGLHALKLPIIQYFEDIVPSWRRGVFVGINELLLACVNAEPSLKSKFELHFEKTYSCGCCKQKQSITTLSTVLSENVLKQTSSVQNGLRRSLQTHHQLDDICDLCGSARTFKGIAYD